MPKMISRSRRGRVFVVCSLALLWSGGATAAAPARSERPLPAHVGALKLAQPRHASGIEAATLDLLAGARTQSTQVIVRLRAPSVAERPDTDPYVQQDHNATLEAAQQAFLARVRTLAPSARVLARTKVVLNAVFLEVNALEAAALAGDPDVQRVVPVGDYDLDLTETVPYIGAAAVQAAGITGSGVRVAVLDSGIDYLHADLGGSGDPLDYELNDPTLIEPGTFPTGKVTRGYDFVGSNWPFSDLEPDADPLDDGIGGGHGTHVAAIIGGQGGVAPSVELYALKVCSSVATSCSGVGLIQAMEYAVDPNGDGDPSDHVDLVNMSLGSLYGQAFDDDLALAVENASALGVLSVAAAGNSADLPFIVSTPSAARSALAVAQTQVPSAFLPYMEVIEPATYAGNYVTVWQTWSSVLTSIIEGPVTYGDGAGGNLNGCAAFAPGSLAGQIVVVDRGACFFSDKVRNIELAGGVLGVIALVAPGDPFDGGFGGGDPIGIPGYMVSQVDGDMLRTGAAYVRFDPDNGLALVGTLVSTSSRGPRMGDLLLKPEIGAPGASVSAVAGSGTGRAAFGGTSGATPMVTGAAALLIAGWDADLDHHRRDDGWRDDNEGGRRHDCRHHGKWHRLDPLRIKALLMNNADADMRTTAEGELAPVSRIGSGEVRVDRAYAAKVVAWSSSDDQPVLSFGHVDVAEDVLVLRKRVRIENFGRRAARFTVTPVFRYGDDFATGAVSIEAPSRVRVDDHDRASFTVTMTVRGALLSGNFMNSGTEGGNPSALTTNEYDGYLALDDGTRAIHLPWHVLPRRAAKLEPQRPVLTFDASGVDYLPVDNRGVGTAQNDAYALVAQSDNLPAGASGAGEPTPDLRAVGVMTYPVPAGYCSDEPSFIWAFAINTWERQTHLVPVSHEVWLDTDRDGLDDFVVLNRDLSVFSTGDLNSIGDGRQVTLAFDLNAGEISAYFFTEHATQTGNTALYVCGEQVGLTGSDMLATSVNMTVYAQDFYFGGPGDVVAGLVVTPLGERYVGYASDVAGGTAGEIPVVDYGPWPGNTDELGLFLVTNGDRGTGARGGATYATEALLVTVPGV